MAEPPGAAVALQDRGTTRTRLAFWMLFAYLLAQAYLIPIWPVGPTWAVWPRLADLAFLGLLGAWALGSRSAAAVSPAQAALARSLALVYALGAVSYAVMAVARGESSAVLDGLYQLARLAQFFLLFWFTSQIELDAARLRKLGLATELALLVVCLSVALTYFEVIPLRLLTAHLPPDPEISGNWTVYAHLDKYPDVPKGLGTVSYNHGYASVLILWLMALRLHLFGGRGLHAAACLLLGAGAVLLTESRAGLAAFLLFAAVFLIRNPKALLGALVLAVVVVSRVDWRRLDTTLERQSTIVSATADDNLSGRPEVWARHLKSLRDHPWRVICGGGLGSSRTNGGGSNAHMVYLEIVSDAGVLGLLVFLGLAVQMLSALYRHDAPGRPAFWASVGLLISGATQETFYPSPALGHFLGLYLTGVAIVLRKERSRYEASPR